MKHSDIHDRTRWPHAVLLALGIGLIAAPVFFQMFSRAPKGAQMLADFRPFMTEQRLTGYQAEIGQIDSALAELKPLHQKPSPALADLQQQWPDIHSTMSGLLDEVHSNLDNYEAVAALPSFTLFPWFFVVPGCIVAVAGAVGLARPGQAARVAAVVGLVVGVGLVLAPAVFHMFTRAPQGGRMMSAFTTIETPENVQKIQGYFGTMAAGQGAIRLDYLPALERSGWTAGRIAHDLPATTALNADWVRILNDMTPMIGAMSDNVDNYQAIAALPPFPLFPWFFVAPGVLLAGAGSVALRRQSPIDTVTPDVRPAAIKEEVA